MPNIPMVDLIGQYRKIKPELDQAFAEVLETCQFINGEAVKSFARNLEEYLQVEKVIPCANGTDSLQIALMAMGLKPGDEVITVPFTFISTAEVIALLGLKPVFVDIDPDTFNINVEAIEPAITEKTKCIIPVHLFGQSADMEPIMDIAGKHGIYVLEDNAQTIGADYIFKDGRRQKAGTIGHIGSTSFFPSKNLGAYGDGGALFTNDEELGAKIKMIANHGQVRRYYHDEVGVNSRLDTLQAAVLNVKLKRLDEYCRARQAAAAYYDQLLGEVGEITVPGRAPYSTHVFHQYTVKLENNRGKIRQSIQEQGIATGVYYPVPLHLQNAYKYLGYNQGDFPVSEKLAGQVLSLPMHTELTEDTQQYIVNSLVNAMKKN